jgi:hypothetical protein
MQVQTQHVAGSVLPAQGLALRAGQRRAGKVASGGHRGVLGGLAMVDFIAGHRHASQSSQRPGQ